MHLELAVMEWDGRTPSYFLPHPWWLDQPETRQLVVPTNWRAWQMRPEPVHRLQLDLLLSERPQQPLGLVGFDDQNRAGR
jgi:hypothetical protein